MRHKERLENSTAVAISLKKLAEHFAKVSKIDLEFSNTDASQIFRLDESKILTRSIRKTRVKRQ